VCLGERGRYEDALAAYDRALALDPEDADVWNNRGVALHELGRTGQARAAYDRAIALDPGATEAAENRALLDADSGGDPVVAASSAIAPPDAEAGAVAAGKFR
jgi:Flp pilus assembly protein TadD